MQKEHDSWLYVDRELSTGYKVFLYPDFTTALYGEFPPNGTMTWGVEVRVKEYR